MTAAGASACPPPAPAALHFTTPTVSCSADEEGLMTSSVYALCPECGDPAVRRPPRVWTPAWGPRPTYSHSDGQPLCPVVVPDGYQPAEPVHTDGSPIQLDRHEPGEH